MLLVGLELLYSRTTELFSEQSGERGSFYRGKAIGRLHRVGKAGLSGSRGCRRGTHGIGLSVDVGSAEEGSQWGMLARSSGGSQISKGGFEQLRHHFKACQLFLVWEARTQKM